MKARTVQHATFVIEANYDAPVDRVYAAFADPALKRRWFGDAEGWKDVTYDLDFRVGGSERSRSREPGGGQVYLYQGRYHDIVPNGRIVVAYDMTVDGKQLSSSLATVEFLPADGNKTRLIYTEQAAYLDGADKPEDREAGCRWLLDQVRKVL